MNDSCRKVSRGQVWFLVDNDVPAVHTAGSIQGKNRPWLVVSNNQCNQSSPTYTVVPLTTANKIDLPTHVEFMLGEKRQTIMCEQIRTVAQQAFFNSGSHYMLNMSEKYMALVDEALAVQLGLSLVFPNSERYWDSLERLIRTRVKQAIADSKVEAVDVSRVATLLDTKVESLVNEALNPKPAEEKVEEPAEENTDDPEVMPPTEKPKTWVPVKHTRTRNTWTDETKREFLEYIKKNGKAAAAAKYDMKLGSVYSMKMKFEREMREDESDEG